VAITIGHIGILGLDRAGVENYQITLGGDRTKLPLSGNAPTGVLVPLKSCPRSNALCWGIWTCAKPRMKHS
jgi:hypothetical protein